MEGISGLFLVFLYSLKSGYFSTQIRVYFFLRAINLDRKQTIDLDGFVSRALIVIANTIEELC